MPFHLPDQLKGKTLLVDYAFYLVSAILVAAVACYVIFAYKTYLQEKKLNEFQVKIAAYGTQEQKEQEKEVLDYKKKIDDFSLVLSAHKLPSRIFTFLERNTLPNVWYSNFDLSVSTNEMRLAGEAETMAVLSKQFKIFEDQKEQVKNISVLNSQISPNGNAGFVLSIVFYPTIFVAYGI